MRTGPAMFDLDDFSVTSYLDGLAMVSKFDIKDGKVAIYVGKTCLFLYDHAFMNFIHDVDIRYPHTWKLCIMKFPFLLFSLKSNEP